MWNYNIPFIQNMFLFSSIFFDISTISLAKIEVKLNIFFKKMKGQGILELYIYNECQLFTSLCRRPQW